MAATTPWGRVLRLSALAALLGASLLAWGASDPALAGNATACNDVTDTVELFFDKPGTRSRVSAGYDDTNAANHQLGYRHKGTEADGTSVAGSGFCGNTGEQWATLLIVLGNRDDTARLDARMPRVVDMDQMPSFVDVNINGGAGDDDLRGHKGRDDLYGQKGDDVIRIAGGGADYADCGPGHDQVFRSNNDITANCEDVVG